MLSSLAREAAELLWEMVATEDIGDAMQQMRENATTIQVLRRPPAAAEQPSRACAAFNLCFFAERLDSLALCVLSCQKALTAMHLACAKELQVQPGGR